MMEQNLDPWGTSNVKDYARLCREFGIEEFSKILPEIKNPSLAMRRGVIFGHKDMGKILGAKKFVVMTGLMPSGVFHFGHKIVLDQVLYYQNMGAECFIAVADVEAYLTRGVSLEKAREIAINEYLVNYIALGLKPKNVHFYFQSSGPRSYMVLSKLVAKRTTFNEIKNIYGDTSPAKLTSALTQVADILFPQLDEFGGPRPTVVPVGADQLPHINFTRDIAERTREEFGFMSPSATFNVLLPGLKGGKMSSSDPASHIALTDSLEAVSEKIKKHAFSGGRDTLKEHREKGGNPDIDISYQWLKMMFEPDDKKLRKIHDGYRSGSLLSGELKQILIEKVNSFLKGHQKKRARAVKEIDRFLWNPA